MNAVNTIFALLHITKPSKKIDDALKVTFGDGANELSTAREFSFVLSYAIRNFNAFTSEVTKLSKEDHDKITRCLNIEGTYSDYEFAYNLLKDFLDKDGLLNQIETMLEGGVGIVWDKKKERARFYLSRDFKNVSVIFEAVKSGAKTRKDVEKFLEEYPMAKHPSFYEGVFVGKPMELFLNDVCNALEIKDFSIKCREL